MLLLCLSFQNLPNWMEASAFASASELTPSESLVMSEDEEPKVSEELLDHYKIAKCDLGL